MFNYHEPNIENMQNYLNQESERSSGEGPNWWSIPAGMSSIRILPPWDPTGRVALPVYMHPIEYKSKDMSYTKYNWTCVNKTFNKPCPICEGLAGLSASGIDISNWEANRRQFYFNAIVMHDPTYNQQKNQGTSPGTHVLLKAPKTFYDWVIAQITNPMIGDITSVTNGIDVYVTKEGTGLGTTYSMTTSPNGRTPIPQEYLENIKDLYNLDDIFSAGFDQKQIDELVSHLRNSAGAMSNAIPNMQQQMAGYQTQPPMNQNTTGYPPMNNPMTQNPAPQFNQGVSPMNIPSPAPSQFNQPAGVPPYTPPSGNFTPPVSQNPGNSSSSPMTMNSPSESQGNNLPKCYGQYDSGSVNCVVCPVELQCSQQRNG